MADAERPSTSPAEAPEKQPEGRKPHAYVEFLKKSIAEKTPEQIAGREKSFEGAAKILREMGGAPPYPTYVVIWREDPVEAANFIAQHFPAGLEKEALVRGLRIQLRPGMEGTSEYKDYQEAAAALEEIIAMLEAVNGKYYKERQLREAVVQKEGTITDNLRDGVQNLVHSFQSGSGTEKLITLAACGIAVKLLIDLWKMKIPGTKEGSGWTFGKLFTYAAGAVALNILSGKVSKDGKTLLQRLDIGTAVENLRGGIWGGFALMGKDRDPNKNMALESPIEVQTMLSLGPLDMKNVLDAYEEHDTQRRKEFTEAQMMRIGLPPADIGKINGKAAFKAVDKLIRQAGKNFAHFSRKGELEKRGYKPSEIKGPIDYNDPGWGVTAIKLRYTEGLYSSMKYTFEEVMTQEMIDASIAEGYTDVYEWVTAEYKAYDDGTIPSDIKKGIGAMATAVYGAAETAAREVKNTAKSVWKTSTGWLEEKWDEYYPKARKLVGSEAFDARKNDTKLARVFDATDTVEVIAKDAVLIRGVRFTMTKTGSKDNPIYKIGELNITPSLGQKNDTNSKNIAAILKRAEEKVKGMMDRSRVKGSSQEKDNVGWNKTEQMWTIEKVEGTIQIVISADGQKVEAFRLENWPIEDFNMLLNNNTVLTPELVRGKIAILAGSDEFHEPFEDVYAYIAGADENLWSRVRTAWDKKIWGVLPNIEAGVSGRLVELRFRYILDYKKAELLHRFEQKLLKPDLTIQQVQEQELEEKLIDEPLTELRQLTATLSQDTNVPARAEGYMKQLEHLGYGNQDYQDEFDKFIAMIGQFDYAGFDRGEFTQESHIIHTRLITLWYHLTAEASGDTCQLKKQDGDLYTVGDTKTIMADMRQEIQTRLTKAQNQGLLKRIRAEDVPDPDDLGNWSEIVANLRKKHNGLKLP